jgi:ABC-type proline/glycine betaine transport system permease subunit
MRQPKSFADNFVAALEAMGKRVEQVFQAFLINIVEFMKDATQWLLEKARLIADYLARFLPAAFDLFLALLKIATFYIPSVVLLIIARAAESWICVALAFGWAVLVTMIGLSYKTAAAGTRPTDHERRR